MRRAVRACLAALLSILALSFIAWLAGVPADVFLGSLYRGAFGSLYAVSETILKAVPLTLTALSVVVAFRAGVWNIGGEGQMIVGGLCGLIAARAVAGGRVGTILALLAAAGGGALWCGIAAVLRTRRQAPEVLTTILLNFIAIHLLGFAVNGPLRETRAEYPQTDAVPDSSLLAVMEGTRLHTGGLIAIAACVLVYWLFNRTAEGLRWKAIGFNASASRWAGIPVERHRVRAMLVSGALAGLAGGIELLGVTHRLYERFATGAGYTGITVALLAQLEPLASFPAGLFFAALITGGGELQRSFGIPSAWVQIAQGVVIVALLLLTNHRLEISAIASRLRGARKDDGEELSP